MRQQRSAVNLGGELPLGMAEEEMGPEELADLLFETFPDQDRPPFHAWAREALLALHRHVRSPIVTASLLGYLLTRGHRECLGSLAGCLAMPACLLRSLPTGKQDPLGLRFVELQKKAGLRTTLSLVIPPALPGSGFYNNPRRRNKADKCGTFLYLIAGGNPQPQSAPPCHC